MTLLSGQQAEALHDSPLVPLRSQIQLKSLWYPVNTAHQEAAGQQGPPTPQYLSHRHITL